MYNRDRIMRKLLGKPAAESPGDASLGVTSSPTPAAYRPIAAQNAAYNAGAPIASLDKSPDGRSAVIASRHILRVVRLDGLAWTDVADLRGIITSQQTSAKASSSSSTSDQLSIKEVKWAQGQGDTAIFTACANGKIFQYDLARLGSGVDGGPFEFIQTREDSRQVNTLDINPHRASYLLSGSQDGIVRCFDIRSPVRTQTGHLAFRALQAFKCNADGVRHVKWSPRDGFYFACGTEQGAVLKWDIRKATAPMLRINAHEKACASVAWHQDGEHLISGGWDNKCHVWDVSSKADKRQKAKWTILTAAPVAAVAWRPGQWSATAQGKRAAQVAVTYDDSSQMRHGINACHIWDLARPTMPFREITSFDKPPASLLWHDQDLLWTAGHDCLLNQFDVAFAPKVIDRTAMSTMAFSSRGEVLMFLDERPPAQRPRPATVQEDSSSAPQTPYSASPTTPMLSISRSDSEDEVIGSFLGARKKAPRRRRPGPRSANTVSTTPPGGPDDPIMALEQSLRATGFFKTQQGMAIGPVPSAAKVDVYHYLSVHYLETLGELLPYRPGGQPMAERVLAILEHYARAAEHVSHFRLAQTWRILAYAMKLLLTRRAQYHVECRRQHSARRRPSQVRNMHRAKTSPRQLASAMRYLSVEGNGMRRALSGTSLDGHGIGRSLLSEEIESTSNVPTPIARPVDDMGGDGDNDDYYVPGKKLTPVSEADSFSLPPAAHAQRFPYQRRRLDSEPLSTFSHDSEQTHASTEGYDFYDMDAMSKAIDVPFARKTRPSSGGHTEPKSPSAKRKPVPRQDSDESFAQLFSISSGSRRTPGLTESPGSPFRRDNSRIPSVPEGDDESGSGSAGTDFGSRIRGKHIDESPKFPKLHPLPKPLLERSPTETTEEDDRMITQTTADSLDSERGESHPKPDAYPSQSPEALPPPTPPSLEERKSSEEEAQVDSGVPQEQDYLPWPDDPPYPYPLSTDPPRVADSPLQPYTLLSRALAFETRSSALNSSAMVLLLKPLVPDELIDSYQASSILRQHHSRLMGMKLFIEAAQLRKLCVRGWPGEPLEDWGDNYPAIFRAAQEGVSAGFMCSKCRKPREVDPKNPSAIWRCDRCKTVLGPCAVCGHRDVAESLAPEGPVPITAELVAGAEDTTQSETLGRQEPVMGTWWYCAGCGHGGHATCLQEWHSGLADAAACDRGLGDGPDDSSDGCCPLDGCGHACLPGRWRAESAAARSEELTHVVREAARVKSGAATAPSSPVSRDTDFKGHHVRRKSGFAAGSADSADAGAAGPSSAGASVHSDANEVLPSRAVEIVRERLAAATAGVAGMGLGGGNGGPGGGGGSAGVLGSSPGQPGGERERRKSVKFAGAEERR